MILVPLVPRKTLTLNESAFFLFVICKDMKKQVNLHQKNIQYGTSLRKL